MILGGMIRFLRVLSATVGNLLGEDSYPAIRGPQTVLCRLEAQECVGWARLPLRSGRLDGRTNDRQVAPHLFTIATLLRIAQVLVRGLDLGLPTLC